MTGYKQYLGMLALIIGGLAAGKLYSAYKAQIWESGLKSLLQNESLLDQNQADKPREKSSQAATEKPVIFVSIKGAVGRPGNYRFSENTRFEELLKAAGGYLEGALRVKKNYYLKNGMEFTIKYREKIKVSVSGAVNKPGDYEMYRGDRLEDLLKKAGGVGPLGVAPEKNYFLKDGQRFFIREKREKDR